VARGPDFPLLDAPTAVASEVAVGKMTMSRDNSGGGSGGVGQDLQLELFARYCATSSRHLSASALAEAHRPLFLSPCTVMVKIRLQSDI